MPFLFGSKGKSKWLCKKCSRENYKDAQFCEYCGTKRNAEKKPEDCRNVPEMSVRKMIICQECGYHNPEGTAFCQECGILLQRKKQDDDIPNLSEIPDFTIGSCKNPEEKSAPNKGIDTAASSLSKTTLCPECGAVNSSVAVFCEECGSKLTPEG